MSEPLDEYKRFPIGLPMTGGLSDTGALGFVYVIGFNEPGIVKIGSAVSVALRLEQLQCGNPFELKVHGVVSIYDIQPVLVEFAAHKRAKQMGTHIRGEWFQLDGDDALRCVIAAARSKRAHYGPWYKAIEEQWAAQKIAQENELHEAEIARRTALRRKLGMDDEALTSIEI